MGSPQPPPPHGFAGAAALRSPAQLVRAAQAGERPAWEELVERYSGLVWAVTRSHRLGPADASDVSQTVWLRLVENLSRLRDPEHLGGWLTTTARHECLRTLRRSGRELPSDETPADSSSAPEESPEWRLLEGERQRFVWLGMSRLSPRCQILLRTLAHSPDASYEEISAALGMPVGSIGPTRARCLSYLRRELTDMGFLATPERDRDRGADSNTDRGRSRGADRKG